MHLHECQTIRFDNRRSKVFVRRGLRFVGCRGVLSDMFDISHYRCGRRNQGVVVGNLGGG